MTVVEFARMGGKAKAAKMSPEQRSAFAKKMVTAREAKKSSPVTPATPNTSNASQ